MSEPRLPNIVVLATGGTIAGARQAHASTRYTSGALTADDLIDAVPALRKLAEIRTEQIANIGSQDMSHAIWLLLAHRIEALMLDAGVQGIVVTHGTDTLEETAYFLSLVLQPAKPVVLVGAMRPATALSPDGPLNLFEGVAVACRSEVGALGPVVVMNSTLHTARDAQKISASGIAAFASPNRGPVGVVKNGVVVLYRRGGSPGSSSCVEMPVGRADDLPAVAIVYAHAGLDAHTVAVLTERVVGVVLAGVGEGNASQEVVAVLARAASRGVAVVRASRCGRGDVARNGEIDDGAAGFIAAGDLSPQKARILLMLGLLRTREPSELQRLFDLS